SGACASLRSPPMSYLSTARSQPCPTLFPHTTLFRCPARAASPASGSGPASAPWRDPSVRSLRAPLVPIVLLGVYRACATPAPVGPIRPASPIHVVARQPVAFRATPSRKAPFPASRVRPLPPGALTAQASAGPVRAHISLAILVAVRTEPVSSRRAPLHLQAVIRVQTPGRVARLHEQQVRVVPLDAVVEIPVQEPPLSVAHHARLAILGDHRRVQDKAICPVPAQVPDHLLHDPVRQSSCHRIPTSTQGTVRCLSGS